MRVAVVGGGIAGLSAAYVLKDVHDVTLFEREDRLGGHAHTLRFDRGADRGVAVDIGFMMLNDRTYPRMLRLLKHLGDIPLRKTSVSFSYCSADGAVAYGFGDPGGALPPSVRDDKAYARLLVDIVKFGRRSLQDLERASELTMSLGEYLADRKIAPAVIEHYIVPSTAAIWSTAPEKILSDFPAATYLTFMNHHGMLARTSPPQWFTIQGGAQRYVRALERQLGGRVRKGRTVTRVATASSGIAISAGAERETFDAVIMACPADVSLATLSEDFADEKQSLSAIPYQQNDVVLHTESALLPADRALWGAWNFRKERLGSRYSITYHLNRLQDLGAAQEDYFVTLNGAGEIPDSKTIYRTTMSHPIMSRAAERARAALRSRNGARGLWFTGNYMGFGFHEDAIAASLAVCERMGVSPAW